MPSTPPRNVPGWWNVTVGVREILHTISHDNVNIESTHQFSLTNLHADDHNFRIHYSVRLYESTDVVADDADLTQITDWTQKDMKVPEIGFDVDSGETKTEVDAATEDPPREDIDYLQSCNCPHNDDRAYKVVSYTQIKPPDQNINGPWEGDIKYVHPDYLFHG